MTDQTGQRATSMNDSNFARLSMLFLEDALSPEEASELYSVLMADAKRRQQFVDLCMLRCEIDLVLNRRARQAATLKMSPTIVRFDDKSDPLDTGRTTRLAPPPGLLFVAALLILSLFSGAIILWFAHYPPPSRITASRDRAGRRVRQWIPHRPAAPAAAVITGEFNAHWNTPATAYSKIRAGQTLLLKSGLAQLRCSGGAMITLQGPATFMMQSPSEILLKQGRVVVKAVGGHFVVNTRNAVVQDLGTWFAVAAERSSKAEVGVFEGKVKVSDRVNGTRLPAGKTLQTGEAVSVTGKMIRPLRQIGWRQQFVTHIGGSPTSLSLVDLLCGGDGTSHLPGSGIDIRTGIAGKLPQIGYYSGNSAFHRVPALPVVDGCFIPGRGGRQLIDSAGQRFTFPTTNTSGAFILWAGHAFPAFNAPDTAPMSPVLAGVNYAGPGHDLVYMHPNKGITLNLRAIRRLHPGLKLVRFRATVGNTYSGNATQVQGSAVSATDIWVIVNGKVRFKRLDFTPRDGAISVNVALHSSDRFLTIADAAATTDIRNHWVILGDPIFQTAGH